MHRGVSRGEIKMKLSNQAIGSLMMAVQKGIMEQCDITELLKDFELVDSVDGLIVENPPLLQVNPEPPEEEANA